MYTGENIHRCERHSEGQPPHPGAGTEQGMIHHNVYRFSEAYLLFASY